VTTRGSPGFPNYSAKAYERLAVGGERFPSAGGGGVAAEGCLVVAELVEYVGVDEAAPLTRQGPCWQPVGLPRPGAAAAASER
jgi:hypothetical protein